jgi:hypothetical protein
MTGRITRLIDDQQTGTIAGDDGLDYTFTSGSLVKISFGSLDLGARVTFLPNAMTKRAAGVQIAVDDIERLR